MAEQWPLSLPQHVQEDSFGYESQDTNVRSGNDYGPQKVRRRFTEPVDFMTHEMWLSMEQVKTLMDFYNITLQNGTLSFDFTHPIHQELREWRFTDPPKYNNLGGRNFIAKMSFELLPNPNAG